jgi:predicted Zn-dependent protease
VYLVRQPSINAFVAGGQRIFINTGLLVQAKTPNEVIGVLAHETGHIAGGHLARMGLQMQKATNQVIIGMLIGAAAIAAGAATGNSEASQAGAGIYLGTQGLVQRSLMGYVRAQESSADQAAIKFLDSTGQSGRGMLTLFQRLMNQSLGSLKNANPYVMTHPMPLDRIRNLEVSVKNSPFYGREDPPDLVLRHQLMQAKLSGFLDSAQQVFQKYPVSNRSLPARYARSIAAFRMGDLKNSLREINSLIEAQPAYAYFWELKGQALLESGQAQQAVPPLQKAASRAEDPQVDLAQRERHAVPARSHGRRLCQAGQHSACRSFNGGSGNAARRPGTGVEESRAGCSQAQARIAGMAQSQ